MIGRAIRAWTSGHRGIALLAILILFLVAFPLLAGRNNYFTYVLMTFFIFATFGHAWNLLAGYCGLLSFGNQLYIGVAGFALGLLHYYGQVNAWLGMIVGGIVAGIMAWLLAIPISDRFAGRRIWAPVAAAVALWIAYEILIAFDPAWDVFGDAYIRRVLILLFIFLGALPLLRLQGAYFAVATWLIAAAVGSVFTEWKFVGAGGGLQIKTDTTLELRYYVGLALLAAATLVIWYLLRSRYGLALTAVRDDEEAARTVGIDIRKVKGLVFVVAGAMTGLAACLYYIDAVIITPVAAFNVFWSAYFVFIVVAGGMGTLSGPIIGALIYVVIDRVLSGFTQHGLIVLGVASVLIILFLPRGVMGLVNDLRARALAAGAKRLSPSPSPRTLLDLLFGPRPAASIAGRASTPAGPPGVVAAFLVPGTPLPYLVRHNPPWMALIQGFDTVRKSLDELKPDALVIYSTQWIAVLDQLWQSRARLSGTHVDENWHEYGELPYDMTIDTALTEAAVKACAGLGVSAKAIDYDQFPIDSGTIVANALLNPVGRYPLVIAANNLYHDFEATRRIGAMVAEQARRQGKRVAVIGIGGLSGSIFRNEIDLRQDRIANPADDGWNRRMLDLLAAGDIKSVVDACPIYAREAKVDMGFKHFAWVLGALGGNWRQATVHAYAPVYGSGAAIVEFRPRS
jgi:ABC-type branched-subunit amino acid transport system permease subunit/aromatic ring-opening dioxygenase catalytic subunit (LigB family)